MQFKDPFHTVKQFVAKKKKKKKKKTSLGHV